jgi:hypothetical protein
MRLRSCAAALALAASLGVASAHAAPPDPPPSATKAGELVIDPLPLFGTGGSISHGWNEVVVAITNNGAKPARGTIRVSNGQFGRERREFVVTAPYNAGAGSAINARVPILVGLYGDVLVEVLDEQGVVLSTRTFTTFNPAALLLFDVSEVSRLRGAINDAVVTPLFLPATVGTRGATPSLAVGSPRFDPATGDPMLPDRAALYASADAVLMRSETLARLSGAELDALAGYVLAGGTLAVAITRPEDLRHATLAAFAGGAVTKQAVYAATLAPLAAPSPTSGLTPTSKIITPTPEPSGALAETLAGYSGGNLHGSLYGSSAAYGLGEVHLLAFDPTRKPAVDDPWAQARMVDLARRAFDRRSTQIFRPGAEPPTASYGRVRQQLDPNESSRWAIAAAAMLLMVYAVVAGPISFSSAAKRGHPLRALRWLPIFSAIAFAMVVGIGIAAKGVTGRARHLTLVEAGAGMPKGSARRFRGFYASRSQDLTVRTSDASSVLATAITEGPERRDHLLVDRDGARLTEVAALPWQTVVVREDGFASIGDGIAITKEGESDVVVVNRAGRDLRAGILRTPAGKMYYLSRLKDGDRVSTATAPRISSVTGGATWEGMFGSPSRAGSIDVHHLHAHMLGPVLDTDAPGLANAWWAIEDASAGTYDWFPENVPVLLGQLDGGEGRTADSGLRLESDRVLVRIVGFGGRP